MSDTIRDNSIRATLGWKMLGRRHNEILREHKADRSTAVEALGAMQVIAGQAIRELETAERKSRDPADILAREDAELLALENRITLASTTEDNTDGGW